ncbi:Centromere protein I, partial [Dufourea novaeangliae]
GAQKLVTLVKCLVPRYKIPERTFKLITAWCLSSVNTIPFIVSTSILQWIVGLWDHQLLERKTLNIFYTVFFFVMLKKTSLEKHIARLIYILAKPEDVTRRDVSRLITLQQKYSKPQKHITVLLSLFKSYKPELVPEKIESVNIESVWKPIPEELQKMFQNARVRFENQEIKDLHSKSFNWNTLEHGRTKKSMTPLLPSVRYFQIGSSKHKEKDSTSIFDISSIEELGKSHFSVELPCNAISLLANTAGYHLLTFADFHYQSRFCYNLYNTLIRAFILEDEKFSDEEINKLLDMTAEFSRYMQQGIPVVNHFLNEYLYFNTGEYQSKLLALLQWVTPTSVSDLQENVLVHVQNIYYESSLITKCEIIRTLRILITNLVLRDADNYYTYSFIFNHYRIKKCTIFSEIFDRAQFTPLTSRAVFTPLTWIRVAKKNMFHGLTEFSKDLIICGLNIHVYDTLLLSEALSFYEEICSLEDRSTILSFTLAPPAVIYGGFLTTSCAILSRTCNLLLKYREMSLDFRQRKLVHKQSLQKKNIDISFYCQDIIDALWYDKPFTKRQNKYLFSSIPNKVLNDLEYCDLNHLLNINNHYAILPYKCVLNNAGLDITTKEEARCISLHYYPIVNEFLDMFEA